MMISRLYTKISSKLYRIFIPLKAYRIRRKKIITVVFVFSRVSMWKNDYLYQEMVKNDRFNVMIVIVPDLMLKCELSDVIEECEHFLLRKKYRFINPYAPKSTLSSLKYLNPDIIFYPRPYNAYPDGFRFEDNFGSLFCHSDYGYHTIKEPFIIDTRYINHVWQNYYENESVRSETESTWPHLKNIKVTGLPNTDSFWHPVESQWKTCLGAKYKIIWAPHFSVEPGWLNYSNFLDLAEEMMVYVKSMGSVMQFAFKPHPLLKAALYDHPEWGKEKTDAYYYAWASMENTQLVEGEYIGLFMHSDAMIHDSSSFRVEYIHTNKPVLFLLKDDYMTDGMYEFGIKALDCHYKGKTMNDIRKFISDVVIGRNDPMKIRRECFIKEYLLPPNNLTASQNIINAILGE